MNIFLNKAKSQLVDDSIKGSDATVCINGGCQNPCVIDRRTVANERHQCLTSTGGGFGEWFDQKLSSTIWPY